MALVGNGQVYSVDLKDGEQYIAHPRYFISVRHDGSMSALTSFAAMSSPILCPQTLPGLTVSSPQL